MPRPDTNKYVAKQVLVTVFWGMPLAALGIGLCFTLVGIPLGVLCFILAGIPGARLEARRVQQLHGSAPVVSDSQEPGADL